MASIASKVLASLVYLAGVFLMAIGSAFMLSWTVDFGFFLLPELKRDQFIASVACFAVGCGLIYAANRIAPPGKPQPARPNSPK